MHDWVNIVKIIQNIVILDRYWMWFGSLNPAFMYRDFRLIISLKKNFMGSFQESNPRHWLSSSSTFFFHTYSAWVYLNINIFLHIHLPGCIEPSFKLLQLYDKHPTTQSPFSPSSLSTFTIIRPMCSVFHQSISSFNVSGAIIAPN